MGGGSVHTFPRSTCCGPAQEVEQSAVSELSVQQGRPRSTTRGTRTTEGKIGYHEGGSQEGLASSGKASGSRAQGPDESMGAVPHREVHEQRPEAEGSWVLEQLFKTTDWIVGMR